MTKRERRILNQGYWFRILPYYILIIKLVILRAIIPTIPSQNLQ